MFVRLPSKLAKHTIEAIGLGGGYRPEREFGFTPYEVTRPILPRSGARTPSALPAKAAGKGENKGKEKGRKSN